jgi:hypothetical protein
MQKRDIAGPDPAEQLHRVSGQHPYVMMGFPRVQRPSGKIAVDLVVQALGRREEPGVVGNYQPADRDVEIPDIPD